MADLDEDTVTALLRRVRRRQPRAFRSVPEEVALQRLGVLVPAGSGRDVLVPSLAGLLTLGVYPQQFFPQLNVTFVVLPAASKGVTPEGGPRFIDNRSFGGPIPLMVVDAVDAIARNMRVAATVTGVGREDAYEYPVEALREAVVNALMHRDYGPLARGTQVQVEMYPDRLLVRNPGGLFGAVSEDELGTEGVSSSRNSVLSALLQEVNLPDTDHVICENRGTGIPTILEQLRRAGSASVKFSNAISHFTVVFSRAARRASADAPVRHAGLPEGRAADIMSLFAGAAAGGGRRAPRTGHQPGNDTMSISRSPPQRRDRQRAARCSRCRRARERESRRQPETGTLTLNDAHPRFQAQEEWRLTPPYRWRIGDRSAWPGR